MRRTIIGTTVIVVLVAILGLTSGFRPAPQARVQPSEVGIDAPDGVPFEIGTVMNSQSFR